MNAEMNRGRPLLWLVTAVVVLLGLHKLAHSISNALLTPRFSDQEILAGLGLAMFVLTMVALKIVRIRLADLLGSFHLRYVFVGAAAGLGLFVIGGVGFALLQNFGLFPAEQVNELFELSTSFWALSIATIVFAPLWEETAFRGLGLLGLKDAKHSAWPLFFSTVLFTAYHEPFQWPVVVWYGLILGLLARKFDSLWPPLLAHVTLNAIGTAFLALRAFSGP